MPDSLERLDLLLLTVARTRRVRQDGIRFMGMRYIDPTLAAYVGEDVVLRYDPRDVAEIRVFHRDRFLCRAVCQELAGETVPLREIVSARKRRRRALSPDTCRSSARGGFPARCQAVEYAGEKTLAGGIAGAAPRRR